MIKNLLDELPIVNQSLWNKDSLIQFEKKISDHWEFGRIRGPIHLSGGNEDELIEIFKYILISNFENCSLFLIIFTIPSIFPL